MDVDECLCVMCSVQIKNAVHKKEKMQFHYFLECVEKMYICIYN